MGACNSYQKRMESTNKSRIIKIEDFQIEQVLGAGGFGKVFRVVYLYNGENYAMKQMSKRLIAESRSIRSVMNERKLLAELRNEFIINMKWAFQDPDFLYLVMDQLTGGDLEKHMEKQKFNEDQAKFITACLVLALEYMREKNILHRDVKPQNIVFDDKGYIRLTDMGIARVLKSDNSSDTSGTPNYMAPEVLCKQNHRFEVDYYAVGVIVYEFMLGKKPITGENRKEIKQQILEKQVKLKKSDVPNGWSIEAGDFINKLLERKPKHRLGYKGIEELKQHPWFDGLDWVNLRKKKLKPLFVPVIDRQNEAKKDIFNGNEPDLGGHRNVLEDNYEFIQKQFSGYDYTAPDMNGTEQEGIREVSISKSKKK